MRGLTQKKDLEVERAELTRVKKSNEIMREALEDFSNFGMRTDVNPTGLFHDCGHFTLDGQEWTTYLQSADTRTRERAREALSRAEQVDGITGTLHITQEALDALNEDKE